MHDWINESPRETSIKVECKCFYKDLEKELIELTGYDFKALIDKLKAGYKLQLQKPSPIKYMPDGTPHLIDSTTSYDAIYRYGKPVYVLNIGVTRDDLDEEERRLLSESQEYLAKRRINHENH